MNEQEAKKVFSHLVALSNVFGGDLRAMCAERGIPKDFVQKFLAEQNLWDTGLSKFDWDGSVKRTE